MIRYLSLFEMISLSVQFRDAKRLLFARWLVDLVEDTTFGEEPRLSGTPVGGDLRDREEIVLRKPLSILLENACADRRAVIVPCDDFLAGVGVEELEIRFRDFLRPLPLCVLAHHGDVRLGLNAARRVNDLEFPF